MSGEKSLIKWQNKHLGFHLPGFVIYMAAELVTERPLFEIARLSISKCRGKKPERSHTPFSKWNANIQEIEELISGTEKTLKGNEPSKVNPRPRAPEQTDEDIKNGNHINLYRHDMQTFPALEEEELLTLYRIVKERRIAINSLPPASPHDLSIWRDVIASGDKAVQRLTIAHYGLVITIAHRLMPQSRGLFYADLVQEGNIGLMIAIEKYDHERDNAFSTHAGIWISAAIRRAIENTSDQTRIPVSSRNKYFNVVNAILDGDVNEESVRMAIAKTGAKISEDRFWQIHWAISQISLNRLSLVREEEEIINSLQDGSERIDDTIAKIIAMEELNRLNPGQRSIMELFLKGFSWQEIGSENGTSRQAAWQKGRRAMARIERRLRPREEVLFQAK